jgi:hypothetical protein
MRIDLYTKLVLTGILGCLLWLCATVSPVATPVHAQLGPTPVIVAGYQANGTVKALEGGLPVVIVQAGSARATAAPASNSDTAVAVPLVSPAAASAPAQVSSRCQATTKKGTQCSSDGQGGQPLLLAAWRLAVPSGYRSRASTALADVDELVGLGVLVTPFIQTRGARSNAEA